ncbi:DEAD/DEAH box helicase family protein [Bartonella sp. HY038]|uniref:DEAD/DEAH box helicase family protein n=1 Tax=Bartonella sp. HY038 TaxID=2759660 RepID=UPI0015FE029F|nr:DEAD/DEAH box helicase family protein [Bartonella sp. HY038]
MAKAVKKQKLDLLFNQWEDDKQLNLFMKTINVSDYIKDNLKDDLRPYQEKALRNLQYSQNEQGADFRYNHLLFNMATGSGKTMVMAAVILYMFKEFGYQNFIFFVHTDAIIQKTKENLLNPTSSKYLFADTIEINGRQIEIKEVDTFPAQPDKHTIYIKFSTIHKIHDEFRNRRENCVSAEDLKEFPLVLLGDEAHHFNAATKKSDDKEDDEKTWENTVEAILRLQPKNRLFEFTATIDLENKNLYDKYKNKIVYQYDLKQFMSDGYSKKVMLLEADQNDDDKMLDAVLLSQYRKLVAMDNGIKNFKPVILFKSNLIAVSKAKQEDFIQMIEALSPNKIEQHLTDKQSQISITSIWNKVIERYAKGNLLNIVQGIQKDFDEMNLLNVNKTDLMEERPVLLNTLEEMDNPIRAVFAVAKVNEGWDVLNLYDIVRIKEKASSSKTGAEAEAQLIGRGARYYPFIYNGEKSYIRRFDNSVSDLSVLEQLHYHTINDPSYITNLHASLENANVISQVDGSGKRVNAKLKEEFKESKIYREGKLFFNKVEEIKDNERTWESYSLDKIFEVTFKNLSEVSLDKLSNHEDVEVYSLTLEVDKRYFQKAIQSNDFYQFDNLKKYFPTLESIEEFIVSDEYLKQLTIIVQLPSKVKLENLSAKDKLKILNEVMDRIANNIKRNNKKYIGTYNFVSKPLKEVITDYSMIIDETSLSDVSQIITAESSIGKTWYVYDQAILNQLEHRLIKLLEGFMSKLKEDYSEIYVIRNDERSTRFKLTEFNAVRGFMPDFIMIMTKKESNEYYQVFLEPKGGNRLLEDQWKEEMLETINSDRIIIIGENDNVRLVGIKFYNDDAKGRKDEFVEDFERRLYDGKKLLNTAQRETQPNLLD